LVKTGKMSDEVIAAFQQEAKDVASRYATTAA